MYISAAMLRNKTPAQRQGIAFVNYLDAYRVSGSLDYIVGALTLSLMTINDLIDTNYTFGQCFLLENEELLVLPKTKELCLRLQRA